MLEKFNDLKPKPRNLTELKTALQTILNNLPDETIRKSVLTFRKRLRACIKAQADISNIRLINIFSA